MGTYIIGPRFLADFIALHPTGKGRHYRASSLAIRESGNEARALHKYYPSVLLPILSCSEPKTRDCLIAAETLALQLEGKNKCRYIAIDILIRLNPQPLAG